MTIEPLTPLVMNQLDRLITKAECDRVIKVEVPTDLLRRLAEIAKEYLPESEANAKAMAECEYHRLIGDISDANALDASKWEKIK